MASGAQAGGPGDGGACWSSLQLVPYGWRHPNPAGRRWRGLAQPRGGGALPRRPAPTATPTRRTGRSYSYVAPMSWLVRNDVEDGRDEDEPLRGRPRGARRGRRHDRARLYATEPVQAAPPRRPPVGGRAADRSSTPSSSSRSPTRTRAADQATNRDDRVTCTSSTGSGRGAAVRLRGAGGRRCRRGLGAVDGLGDEHRGGVAGRGRTGGSGRCRRRA